MTPASAFFVTVLALQAVFTAAIVILVGRRYPARLRLYRWLAPAAVPVLLVVLVSVSFAASYSRFRAQAGAAFDINLFSPLVRIVLAYAVLWLIGVLFAGMLIRLVLRRR
jgi:hypothetical protein